ncbi:MAG TPA: glutathione S-transferase N-terminal domain-containing protein [Ramlibacter sp.]|uniref:glutathione S-transferase N-terminal domain-containing protein n=1 Tax=Ramlibacter sp. TaxID=1917967 RepID=UPI002CE1FB43|nr:glutathione S-transferase N-terminal domain-containing protein [Ramlibacter sp.]HVZ44698.1 glutathione S-transferase N-terminal domain-containing protein [Ramlibacter sp.]
MKLFFSSSSPFARKVRVFAREKGLAGGLSEVECNPYANSGELAQANRLGLVPTLVVGTDLVLYDSPVICEYLESRNDRPRLIPQAGGDRWRVLRAQALADGLMELAVAMTVEGRRPVQEQSAQTQARRRLKIAGALQMMEEQLPDLTALLNLGHIAFAAALGYLDFRHADLGWRAKHPALADWFDPFAQRPAMLQTAPSDSSYAL